MLKQIAGFRLYLGYLKQGYRSANQAIAAINSIKKGDSELHKKYFVSFTSINPNISASSTLTSAIGLQQEIIKVCQSIKPRLKSDLFTRPQVAYINKFLSRLLLDCADDIELVVELNRGKGYKLDDAERLRRLQTCFEGMYDKYVFAVSFNNEVNRVVRFKFHSQKDIQNMQALYDLK
ncbi:hypothetical protein EXU57_24520 [Segetibacter sp. 3557_3]|uniref:hypothetical protein n=1 Tax=Segetibacter sp. 3557_3 TaxID=2547429 RepID=UPI0010585C29|nr:hypothetical protein [Segetibacter sp. 3557_3]TDH18040.1 hypothetical protein EXU57_24520 [Segetibacter sp. 3557_3]